ncbi:MAG: hypothetical protein LC754_13290 [Acidobacteria bacterium]|nr:hypothetical protein [Acidobacteriota bacterium]
MHHHPSRPTILSVCVAALVSISSACSNSAPPERVTGGQPTPASAQSANPPANATDAPVATLATPAQPTPAATPAPELAPPQASEIRAALARTYGDAVVFDERDGRAVVGDFNGDDSPDLAVAVRPAAGKFGELNSEHANWILEDPTKVAPPDPRRFDPHQGVQKLAPPAEPARVQPGDTLLAVIHGYKQDGWRNPEARQTYLLRHAVAGEMNIEKATDARSSGQKRLPQVRGDVIHGQLDGAAGFLYWTGAKYGWFR